MHADADLGSSQYLDRLMRRGSFEALWPLFARAPKPAKEMTESYSALEHLRPWLQPGHGCRVIHVGDGAHALTGALFSLKTQADNISVDPALNETAVQTWRDRFGIRRLSWHKAAVLDMAEQFDALPDVPVFVTFVHAHVRVDDVLDRLRWDVAFTLACCVPGHQLSDRYPTLDSGFDRNVLSSGRRYQVLANPSSRLLLVPPRRVELDAQQLDEAVFRES